MLPFRLVGTFFGQQQQVLAAAAAAAAVAVVVVVVVVVVVLLLLLLLLLTLLTHSGVRAASTSSRCRGCKGSGCRCEWQGGGGFSCTRQTRKAERVLQR